MSKNIFKKAILIQAPADIPYALDIISKQKVSELIVFVINVENNYKLLKKILEKEIRLEYIPYPFVGFNSIRKVLKTRKDFGAVWDRLFDTVYNQISDVYFFSRFEDPFVDFLIARFSKKQRIKIHYVNHYDPDNFKLKFKDVVRSIIFNPVLSFITGARFKITHWQYPELDVKRYKCIDVQIPDISTINNSRYLFSVNKNESVLLLVNPKYNNCFFDFDHYITVLKSIITALKELGTHIYIKGHPRMGLPKELEGLYDEIIEDFVISELIDYSCFSLVIGCESTAIAHASLKKHGRTVSILNLLQIVDYKQADDFKRHLVDQSNNQLLFVNTINEIVDLYKSGSMVSHK